MFATLLAIVFGAWVPPAGAQWTVTFVVDQQQAATVLGQERVDSMLKALARVKGKMERILTGSTGSSIITVDWRAPSSPQAVAEADVVNFYTATVTAARDKLINKAGDDGEPAAEVLLYESLPTTSVPFRYETTAVLSASFVRIPNSLNKHLAFHPSSEQNDGTIRFRPPATGTLHWQFWPARGTSLVGHEVFEVVAIHEVMHVLGYQSAAEWETPPTFLESWDLFRFADTAVSVSATLFTTLPRELRPTQEATAYTRLGTPTGAYKLSRGTRSGGDDKQASHWRSFSLLNPQTPIGVMDPNASSPLFVNLSRKFYTRADVEALDVMGWNVDPNAVPYANAGSVDLVAPAAAAQFAAGEPITFQWQTGDFLTWDVYVYSGTEIVDDNPVRVFYEMPVTTLNTTLESANALPPGEYVWVVVGSTFAGNNQSEERRFTITPPCDADVNCDLALNGADVEVQELAVGGDLTDYCLPDPDFNGDFAVNGGDVEAVEVVVGGGPCP